MPTLSTTDHATITALIATLQSTWNAGDGHAFAAPFAEDVDFVNVRAEHMKGRDVVAAGHVGIFKSIYANSTVDYDLDRARLLSDDLALVHVRAALDVPEGPLAGQHYALFSMVLQRAGEGWEITAFHNTMRPPVGK